MIISSSDLLNLPVFTQSGRHLGRISGFDVDVDTATHTITRYYVHTGLIQGLWHQQLVIDHRQVVSIDDEKMIVDDATVPDGVADLESMPLPTPAK